jgi:hypothetical protein
MMSWFQLILSMLIWAATTRSAALADRIRGEEVWKMLGAKLQDYNAKHGH